MEQLEMMEPLFFFGGDNEFACFSNFYPSNIMVDGRNWPTVEHYFQAMKSTSMPDQEKVRSASSPGQAKKLGRSLPLRSDWESVREEVMLTALRAKFSQHQFKTVLLKSGDRLIYEDSPYDTLWGTGALKSVGKGQNLLGKLLMKVRAEISREQV